MDVPNNDQNYQWQKSDINIWRVVFTITKKETSYSFTEEIYSVDMQKIYDEEQKKLAYSWHNCHGRGMLYF